MGSANLVIILMKGFAILPAPGGRLCAPYAMAAPPAASELAKLVGIAPQTYWQKWDECV
jgi:hypothetical protein